MDLLDQARVVPRIGHHPHRLEVLCRRPDHRRAPDVDLLDGLIEGRAPRDSLAERVEVHHHEVERLDALGFELGEVRSVPLVGQDPGMDPRVQRLDPPAKHLGGSRDVRHRRDEDAGALKCSGRVAGRDQFHAQSG